MSDKKNRASFAAQKCNAKKRGIEWKLTFEEWLNWWGDDLTKRGTGHDKLQMQRYSDNGAYELGNIRKGYPKQNSATWANIIKKKKTDKAKRDHEAFLDMLMSQPSKEPQDDYVMSDENQILTEMVSNGLKNKSAYVIDKR